VIAVIAPATTVLDAILTVDATYHCFTPACESQTPLLLNPETTSQAIIF